jgi:hypothetical protein
VRRSRRAIVVALALLASSCAPPLMKLPSGAGTAVPLPDATAALQQATASCRAIHTLTAEIAVTGSAAGQRVRARLLAGVAAPASARLEATAPFGAPLFIFVASGDDASLLLPRDNRVLRHGRPDEVLDAVAGIPLTAADLERTLAGCPNADGPLRAAVQFGDRWQKLSTGNGSDAFITRDSADAPWRLGAVSTPAWRIDYPGRQDAAPAAIRLMSVDGSGRIGRGFDLRLQLSQVETNTPLDAAAFRIDIPADAVPISVDELRHARPGVREN